MYRAALDATNSVATGKLKNFKQYCQMEGTLFEVIFVLEDYWWYVENGRRAGKFPPPDAIKKWIRVKPVVPRAFKGKVPTTNQLAYLIGRKIATKGIAPKKQLQQTLNDAGALIDKLVSLIANQMELEFNNDLSNG